MLSIASAAVQTRGGAVAERFVATFARLEEALAGERHQLILWAPVMLGAGIAAYFVKIIAAGVAAFAGMEGRIRWARFVPVPVARSWQWRRVPRISWSVPTAATPAW